MAGQRNLETIDCLIRDVDNKNNERILAKLLHNTKTDLMPSESSIFDRLKTYLDCAELGSQINYKRALKIFYLILEVKAICSDDEFNQLKPCLESIWAGVNRILMDDNFKDSMELTLDIFERLAGNKRGYGWLIEQDFDLPTILYEENDYTIKDVVSLVRFCVRIAETNSIRDSAGALLGSLVLNSMVYIPHVHHKIGAIRDLIADLASGDQVSIHALIDLLNSIVDLEQTKDYLLNLYDIPKLIEEKFFELVSEPQSCIDNISSCLAKINGHKEDFHRYLERLVTYNKLDGIIIYLSESNYSGGELSQSIQIYMLYPLLKDCTGQGETKELIKRLGATPDQLKFVDSNWSPKIVHLSCSRLKWICEGNFYLNMHIVLIGQTLLNYVKVHSATEGKTENVSLCKSVLRKLPPAVLSPRSLGHNFD